MEHLGLNQNLNTGRFGYAGAGTSTSAICFGGVLILQTSYQ